MHLDVFKSDAFHFTKLVDAINKTPYVPTKLGDKKLFAEEGISTLTFGIEMQDGVLTLVPTAPRGAPGVAKGVQPRNMRQFQTTHLPQTVSIMADEVANLRAFGSETEEEVAMKRLQKKMAIARRDLDITHEWQRMGALKGIVLDADATTVIYNFLTEFGVSASTANFTLSNAATKVLQTIVGFKRTIEDKLGGVANSGFECLCSAEFFDALTSHPKVEETYIHQTSGVLRTDRRNGFEFGGVWWEEYRGSVGGQRFLGANKALLYPLGVPDLFKTVYAPANYMETINTEGVPFYMAMDQMKFNVGVEYQVQSNPLHYNTRPDAVLELTAN
jgi:hypothetical protein